MTERSFQSDTTFYKYTGKERDVTTGYDYFGARYYDSRIGRWGQVEPLLEKYPSVSPYNYAINNPLRVVDADGRDAIVKIEENTITFRVVILYQSYEKTKNSKTSLSQKQIDYYKSNIEKANEQWSAVKEVEYDGKTYNAVFEFEFREATTFEDIFLFNTINDNRGYNIALPSENEAGNPRVQNGNKLIFPDISGESGYPRNWFSHELGHLMGLSHKYAKKDPRMQTDFDIMAYHPDQYGPREVNVKDLMSKIDFNRKSQIILGDTHAY